MMRRRAVLAVLPLLLLASTSGAAVISITAADAADLFYDLSGVYGSSDWAYWSQTSNPLTAPVAPANQKSGADLIGAITAYNEGGVRGSGANAKPEYDFSFTDGTTTASGNVSNPIGVLNTLLGSSGVGNGVQLDVTAPSAEPFTIYVWGTAFGATGTLTATIGSASDSDASLTYALTRAPGKLYTIAVTPDNAGQAVNLRMAMTAQTDSNANASISAVAVAVPEPSTAALAVIAAMCLALRRK